MSLDVMFNNIGILRQDRVTLSVDDLSITGPDVREFKDTPKALFLIFNSFEMFSIEKVFCLCFHMHIKVLQNLQRFGNYQT